RIEHEVVRPAQQPLIRVCIQRLDSARLQVDRLNATPLVVTGLESRHHGIPTLVPLESTIIADIASSVRSDRRAIRATAQRRDYKHFAVWTHTAQRLARNLHKDD